MKAVFEKISPESKQSIVYRKISLPNFDAPYHFHPEYELTYIVKGEGLRYIGTRIEHFEAGDLVLIAPNVPHCWINQEVAEGENVQAIVIQFHSEVFSRSIFQLPEFENLKAFLEEAKSCFVFKRHNLIAQLESFDTIKPSVNFIRLVELLTSLRTIEKESVLQSSLLQAKGHERFQDVFSYIIEHFREPINLQTVSDIAKLSPTSFCRYFKKYTGKTFTQIILEYRLETAAQLLISSQKRISEVAFESGFEDIPYFNRTFKKWKSISPKAFRKAHNFSI